MTGKKIVQELKKLGHTVSFYQRKDGGIRITNIDGIKFSSKESLGNAYGAQLLGTTTTSQKGYQQRIQAGQSAKQLAQTSRSFQKAFKTAQRQAKTGKTPIKITWKDTKATYKKYGEKGTLDVLNDIVRHAQGLAYESHFAIISDYLDKLSRRYSILKGYKEEIMKLKDKLPVEAVDRLINILYSLNGSGVDINAVVLVLDEIINNKEYQQKTLAEQEKIYKPEKKG